MAQKKVTDLSQSTNAELTDAALVLLTADPGGSPVSRKSSLERVGALPKSWLDKVALHEPTYGAVSAGDFTTGICFTARRSGQSCTGVRFYWNNATARTIRCKLWQGGVAQKTVDVAVSGVGTYTGTFGANVITPENEWYVTIWQTTGAVYQLHQTIAKLPPRPVWMRDYVVLRASEYAGGDAQPNTSFGASDSYPVEPVMTG